MVLFDPDWNPACLKVGTLITTADGKSLPVEQLTTRDQLLGQEGEPVNIIARKNGYSDEMYELVSAVGRHTVTPEHLVTIRWPIKPTVKIVYQPSLFDDAILLIDYSDRNSLCQRQFYFQCRPMQLDGHPCDLRRFIDSRINIPFDAAIKPPVIVATIDRILAYGYEELNKCIENGKVQMIDEGELIDMPAHELFQRRDGEWAHLSIQLPLIKQASMKSPEESKVSEHQEESKVQPQQRSDGISTSLHSIESVGGGNYVAIEVDGPHSRFALGDGTITHNCDLQAMSRIWRDGQKHTVYIYRFLSTATIDEKIHQRQMRKEELSMSVIQHADAVIRNFDSKSLKEVFTYRENTTCETRDILLKTKRLTHNDNEEFHRSLGDFHEDLTKALVRSKPNTKTGSKRRSNLPHQFLILSSSLFLSVDCL